MQHRDIITYPKKGGFMQRITENVFTATDSRGCNPSYVVTSDGIVIIDTPQLITKVLEMKEEALKKGPIQPLLTLSCKSLYRKAGN